MKIDSLNLVLQKNFNLNKKIYFISGNEFSLINEIKEIVIEKYKRELFKVIKIENISDIFSPGDLFGGRRICIIKDIQSLNEEMIKHCLGLEDIFVMIFENSPKIKKIKEILNKENNAFVIDCYELTKENKIKIINQSLTNSKIKFNDNLYWLLVDKLDNRYGFLKKELEKIISIKNMKKNEEDILNYISKNSAGRDKIFFEILTNNRRLTQIYNEKVLSENDVFDFFSTFKQFCYLIVNSENKNDFSNSIPRYLFREKASLVNIFEQFNSNKKRSLIKLIFKTEKLMRKQNKISTIIGLRFLLNLRKIVIS